MSEFRSMNVTVMRNGEFHTLTLDETHDVYTVERLVTLAEEKGYEVVSVVVDGYDFEEEMWSHICYSSSIPDFLRALQEDTYLADVICAWLTVNDCADVESWSDSIYFYGSDHETVCREWAESFHRVHQETYSRHTYTSDYVPVDPFPSWMEIDWEETLNNIASEDCASVVEFAGGIFYFSD